MVNGAKTTSKAVLHRNTQPMSLASTVPCIRPRAAVARWVIGFTSTNDCTQPGIVSGSTNTLLANVSGNSTVMLSYITDSGVCNFNPSAVHTHDKLNEKTSSSATAATTPMTPPSGRKPSARPTAMTTTEASV